jgi:predicted kinase
MLPRHIDALARQISEFHSRIPIADPASRFGTPEAVAEPIQANFTYLDRPANGAVQELIDRLRAWSEQELASRRDVFEVRKRDGFIRECHGDMHLGNMILVDDSITIFDCIEFNDSLRWIDIASEVAFCTMDLYDRGRADFGRRFLNGYLEWSGDYAGLAVFPLYFTYRALVRAKVAHLRRAQGDLPREESKRLGRELANYLDLADQSTHPRTPFLAVTHGVSGSGKTHGSQAVVERLGALRVRSDLERKRLAGFSALADTGSGIASGIYSAAFSQRTLTKLAELASAVIGAGIPVIVDATFLKRSDRERFQRLAETLQVPFVILDFPTDEAACRESIRLRRHERSDASEASEAVLDRQLQLQEPLSDGERAVAVVFDSEHPETIDRSLTEITSGRGKRPPSVSC